MPVPEGVGRVQKARGYSLHIMSVLNWVLPDCLLLSSAIPAANVPNGSDSESEEPLLTLGVHVSLFHAESKRFFGNTWVSPELAVDPFAIKQTRDAKDGTLRYVLENVRLNFRAYFISDIVDTNCVGVLELVASEKDPDSKATVQVVGCGWTLLPLFASQQPVQNGITHDSDAVSTAFSMNTSGDSVSVFTGSPRVLWELDPEVWSAHDKYDGSKFYYQLGQYDPMLSVATFVRKNELVGALDLIPGLKSSNLANLDVGNKPEALLQDDEDASYEETLASFARLASLVPKSIQVEEPFELNVIATRVAVNLRDEIEANLVARLKISRKAMYEGAISVEGEVSARVLKVALHNGRCFRTRQFTVPLKAHPNGGDTLFCIRNHSKLRGFVFHPNMAIVVVLQYTVHFRIIWPSKLKQQALEAGKPSLSEEDVVLVTMGARAVVPSDGKKLYLYDKCHLATIDSAEPLTMLEGVPLQEQEERRRVLHVDFLSGTPCRPYSDNALYTPPDQLTRVLHDHEVQDSFAFCDLKITIDDEIASTKQAREQVSRPSSPHLDAREKEKDTALLARTFNALATFSKKKKKALAKASSVLKKQVKRPAVPTPQVLDAPTSELSRASKTLLTRYGYMESHDKPPGSPPNNQKTHDTSSSRKKVELVAKSIEIELNDPFKANEVRFHFAAYKALGPGTQQSPVPSRVYFTFQFYHFPATRSETLRLSKAFSNGASDDTHTFLLMRDALANKPAMAIQFDVDTTASMNPLETRHFAEYLKWHNLYVDVWDADSLFQLGTLVIPLHELLRQGNNVKKFQAEVDILPPLEATIGSREDNVFTFPDTTTRSDRSSIGRIQLLMSCYGVKGEHFFDQHATDADQGTTEQTDKLQPQKSKHRVRARTLVESNPELYRLLSQEGFYSEKTMKDLQKRKTLQRRPRQRFSNASTLTPKEIAILCDLFKSRKTDESSSSGTNATRIKCDIEGKTGLLALLSLRPSDAISTEAKPAEKLRVAVSDHHTPTKEKNPTNAATCNHELRLKRVLNLIRQNHVILADAFAVMDKNQDGFVSLDEFIKAMRSLGAVFEDLSDEDLKLLGDSLDTNQDGKIAYRELEQFVKKPTRLSRIEWHNHIKQIVERAMEKGIRVHHVFTELDVSKDGRLSYDEFERGLNQLGITTDTDKEGVQSLLTELDLDHDGTISYTEFLESLGISIEANKQEVVKETVQNVTEDVREIINRLKKEGISFREIFEHFDTDRNGILSVEEFSKALYKLMQLDEKGDNTLKAFERDAVTEYVKLINGNGDQRIDYREFLTACGVAATDVERETAQFTQAARLQAERKLIKLIGQAMAGGMTIQQVFDHFDANLDGSISLSEFQQSLEKLFAPHEMSAEDAQLIAARFDSNQDGMISKREFQDLCIELEKKQQALAAYFVPHLNKLSSLSARTAEKSWISFCQEEVGVAVQEVATKVMPLMSYFGFVSEDGSVDVDELRALCLLVHSATSRLKVGRDAAVKRLRMLLLKAKSQGVDVKASFAHFDANGDGGVTRVELTRGLEALGCFKDMKGAEFDVLWEQLDQDGSGKIDFSEFRALLTDRERVVDEEKEIVEPRSIVFSDRQRTEEKFRQLLLHAEASGVDVTKCFAHFDADQNGVITTQEFVVAFKQLPGFEDVSDEEIVSLVKILDEDDSGSVSRKEFEAFLRNSMHSVADENEVQNERNTTRIATSKASDDALKSTDPIYAETKQVDDTSDKDDIETGRGSEAGPMAVESSCKSMEREDSEPKDSILSRDKADVLGEKIDSDLNGSGKGRVVTDNPPVKLTLSARSSSDEAVDRPVQRTETELDVLSHATSVLTHEATRGLSQLKQLLQKAIEKGVAVQQSFNHFDKKSKGIVAYDEFMTGLRELGHDFLSLSDTAIIAMAKTLDGKQQNGLCVEDLIAFLTVSDGKSSLASKTESLNTRNRSNANVTSIQEQPSDTECSRTTTDTIQEIERKVENPSFQAAPKNGLSLADGLACNYTFHSNPEIRAVELKLRQSALEAYQRGILPLRLVSRILEEAEDRRGRIPGGTGRERKKRSELLRVEFLQVLMELGFTLLSDQDEDDEMENRGGMYQHVPKMNDHLYARQIERLARYRKHVKSDSNKAHKQLLRAAAKTTKRQHDDDQQAEDSLRRFDDEKTQLLRVLSYYRDGHKKSLVYSLLRRQVTISLTLFPSFGNLLFFELPLTNPFTHNDRFKIELLLPSSRDLAVIVDLEIVRNSDEWTFYRDNLPLAYGNVVSNAHIEDEMIDDHDEVVLEAKDELQIPLRLRWLDTKPRHANRDATVPVSIVIKSCSLGHTVALYKIELHPQPFTCHRVLRFSHPASSIWRWKVKYPRGKFIVCLDPSVAMEEVRNGQDDLYNTGLVSFKCRVGDYPALQTFFIVLYDDQYYARVYQVWQVHIQSKLRVDMHAILGQTVRHELVIKDDRIIANQKERRHVMCFTPMHHRNVMQFRPAQVFTLVPQAFNRIEVAFCTVETGADSEMVVLVNLVDVDTHELVGAWSIHVTLALPVITKTYELRLPIGRAVQKKISYANPWDQPQIIRLRSSAPKLLVPRESVLQLPSNGQAFLRLAFAARDYLKAASQDIYLFINDKRTDQNEECLLFQVTYV